jgi:anti-sigma factor ChrR (cupin superfamily)
LQVKTGECPSVAELLDYADGRAGADARQRVAAHLAQASCGHCREWVERARSLPADEGKARVEAAPATKWERQAAFRDLEEQLGRLED